MSLVRPLRADDVADVARLHRRVFGGDPRRMAALGAEVRGFYLDGPFREGDIPSLVHVDDAGRPTGFIGVHAVPYRIGTRRVRAAFCGALLSADHTRDPLAGARLLKAFLAGPQDLSFSETANPVSQGMWERLRGTVLAPYSLDWARACCAPRAPRSPSRRCGCRSCAAWRGSGPRRTALRRGGPAPRSGASCPPRPPRASRWKRWTRPASRPWCGSSARPAPPSRTGTAATWTTCSAPASTSPPSVSP